ncbi:aminopeptidase y precursor [Grosmannia clavigera kw1407]|uniref:Peptide hydrolase n=1 Tax=Grosmannia clavigera (strain kw1407 / UAMH 11150) TaxID=655863 RepID=F0X740_GROCL|nr:aminopeptidase y precursor [Grosmannia clavigera kw1407]EFX06467.1 aminopeptidase y precursor [Grosmannia clavigera kw1407]
MTGWKAPLATALLLGSVSAVPLLEDKQQLHDVNVRASSKPLVDSESLQASIAAPQLLDRAKALYSIAQAGTSEYGHPTRVIGSAGHEGTLDYVYSTLSSLGDYYTVWNQSFSAVTGMVNSSRLEINGTVMESLPMSLTPPTTNKETVAGPLILVANTGCDASDYPASVAGGIALIKRGNCTFTIKSQLAGNASALAAVVYNNADDSLGGTLGEPAASQVATFAISGADAAPIVAALRNGTKLTATALMDSVVNVVQTKNILAQTVEGDANNCVMLGGHSDSVAEGPGINDDGTGSLGLLELATQLASFSVNNCVRFAWWAGEEEGLLGSDYYAGSLSDEENLKIRLFMDYDMLGSPNFAYQVYDSVDSENPDGSQALRDL